MQVQREVIYRQYKLGHRQHVRAASERTRYDASIVWNEITHERVCVVTADELPRHVKTGVNGRLDRIGHTRP